MTDRLANLVTGLQRLAENARIRGDDIRSSQQWEDDQHVREIVQLLNMVEKVRTVLLTERERFTRVVDYAQQLPTGREKNPQEMSAASISKVAMVQRNSV